MHRSPSKLVLLLMAAAVCSFFLVAHAMQLQPVHPAGASCLPREMDALLAFKQDITDDPHGLLTSWQHGQDCCRWRGVTCSNVTGHVIELDPHDEIYPYGALAGQISPSLLSLEHLKNLNLSMTFLTGPNGSVPEFLGSLKNLRLLDLSEMPLFGRVPPQFGNLSKLEYLDLSHISLTGPNGRVPEFLGSLKNLRHLDLSEMSLSGRLPPQFGNLSKLEYLDLSYTSLTGPNGRVPEFLFSLQNLRHLDLSGLSFSGRVPPQLGNLSKMEYLFLCCYDMYSTDISWLTRLPLLVLDMSYVNLSTVADWPLVVNMIPSLEQLYLERCSLPSANQSHTHLNLTNLEALVLSGNYFDHPIAAFWFWNVTSIKYLYLSETYLYGPFPSALGRMTSLQLLDFSYNGNTSTMMVDLKNLCDLESLSLEGSLSSGNITEFIGKLPRCPSNKLRVLELSDNTLVGKLPNSTGHLTSLTRLDLSNNHLTGALPLGFGNRTSLKYLDLSNNLIGALAPGWGNCTSLEYLDLSNNHLTGAIPPEIGNCTSLGYLTLSNNYLTGCVPSKMGMLRSLNRLDLSFNNLDGLIMEEHLVTLNTIEHIDLSHNSLSGPLPIEFVTRGLVALILSFNYFTGHVPVSICEMQNLFLLDLSNNFIEGELPRCSRMRKMAFLLLSSNNFSGKLPSSLCSYSSLAFLDLAWNNFYGTLPVWIGDLVYLRFLQLSHNMLYGDIPVTITNLKRLRHLNLAGNSISGAIPWSLSNLTAMTQKHPKRPGVNMFDWFTIQDGKFGEVLPVVMKRQELKYGAGIFDVVGIDLSLNHLTGGIPDEITSLNGLLNLNLSWNHLSGKIPVKIGAMKSVESLDLSKNNLSGGIPASLSDLTYLSYLDLSYNNLTGRIPQGRQLDTLYTENPSMYNGNIGLCGPPLERNCSGNNAPEHGSENRSEKVSEPVLFFYFGLGSGFVTGLWVVFCALLFRKAWRDTYFRLFDKLYDNAYVFVLVTLGRITSKATTSLVLR